MGVCRNRTAILERNGLLAVAYDRIHQSKMRQPSPAAVREEMGSRIGPAQMKTIPLMEGYFPIRGNDHR